MPMVCQISNIKYSSIPEHTSEEYFQNVVSFQTLLKTFCIKHVLKLKLELTWC